MPFRSLLNKTDITRIPLSLYFKLRRYQKIHFALRKSAETPSRQKTVDTSIAFVKALLLILALAVAWDFYLNEIFATIYLANQRMFDIFQTESTHTELTETQKYEAFRNSLWATTAFLAAVVAAVSLVFTAWRSATENRRAKLEAKKIETDTYNIVTTNLGSTNSDESLHAIHNLVILADTTNLHQPVISALCEYLSRSRGIQSRSADPQTENNDSHLLIKQQVINIIKYYNSIRKRPITHINLGQTHLVASQLNDSVLPFASFIMTTLSYANLSNSDLRNSCFRRAKLDAATLVRTNLAYGDLHGANLYDARAPGVNLFKARIDDADFSFAGLNGANLDRIFGENVNLHGAQMVRGRAQNSTLKNCDMSFCQINSSKLHYASITGCNMSDANFRYSCFQHAKLRNLDFSGSDFSYCDFRGAQFAQLSKERLKETKFDYACLKGAKFDPNFINDTRFPTAIFD